MTTRLFGLAFCFSFSFLCAPRLPLFPNVVEQFAKVLNSIDVGIAGDRLESSLLQLKVFAPSYSFHFVLFFCCESADVDLEYFCCPVWMVCWSFSVFRDGVLSLSVSVLWSVFVMCDW